MYYPHENDFDNPRDWRWLKTAFMSVFVAVVLSAATTAGTVLWSSDSSLSGSVGTYDPTATQQVPEPVKLGSSALGQPVDEIKSDEGLQKLLNDFTKGQDTGFGLYAENLQTSQTAFHRLDQPFPAHELGYLFIAHEIFRELDTGLLTSSQSAGLNSGLSIQQCLTQMLTADSAVCAVDLGNILGWDKRDSELSRLGYEQTSLARGQATTTARNVARLFKNLAEGRNLSPENTETFLGLLGNQANTDKLAHGLPQLTKLAHQPGSGNSYHHDGGIVYSYGGHYILVMLSGQWDKSESEVNQQLGELSQEVYDYFN